MLVSAGEVLAGVAVGPHWLVVRAWHLPLRDIAPASTREATYEVLADARVERKRFEELYLCS